MRARRLVSPAPYQMTVEEYQLDDAIPAGGVVLRARATAVSAGTEIANYRGITRYRSASQGNPYYPGYSFAGEVVAVAPDVTDWRPGDRVCGHLPHASHVLVKNPARLVRVPEGVSDPQAAMTTLGSIVLNAVHLARIQLGESVAVVGAGLIGQLAAQLARLEGGRPVVSQDFISRRRELARSCGAHAAIDPAAPNVREALAELAPDGFAVVFEATGNNKAVNSAIKLAGRGGRVILLGSTRGTVDDFDPYTDVHLKGVTIIGAHITTTPPVATLQNPWTEDANRRVLLNLMRDGELDVESLISHRVVPSAAGEIYAGLERAPEEFLGVIFDWTSEGE